jgi:hypothetical protein
MAALGVIFDVIKAWHLEVQLKGISSFESFG